MNSSLRISDFDDPAFNPFTAFDLSTGSEAIVNPYQELRELQGNGTVHRGGVREKFGTMPDLTMCDLPKYMVLGFDMVAHVFGSPNIFSNRIYERNIGQAFGKSISTMDAPEHPRYRRLFQKVFSPGAISTWGTTVVAPVVNRLLDSFVGRGKAELVREFTVEYPFRFIYSQVGLPDADVHIFHKLAVGLMCISADLAHGLEANAKLGEYFSQLIIERRKYPGTDLVSLLALAELEGERLTDEILLGFLRQLLNAGGDTTYRATSNTLVGLLTNPEQLRAVCRDRKLVPVAIEEGLRWEAPSLAHSRSPLQDVVLGGIEIPAGAAIDVVTGSANRDADHFPDPDRFDIFRKPSRIMTFAFGPHICIGQHLARLEMNVALNAILDRLPNLRLDDNYPPPTILGLIKRSPASIYVRFG